MAKYTAENNYGVDVEKHIWEVHQQEKLLSKIIINNKTFFQTRNLSDDYTK